MATGTDGNELDTAAWLEDGWVQVDAHDLTPEEAAVVYSVALEMKAGQDTPSNSPSRDHNRVTLE